ncbi:polysaccharide biosynthesis protein GumN [Cellulophaga lytica]|uniref:TraB/GumN family protein n=1 Tax=Cellulophaga lytica TaxID=979 RepID=UPI0009507ED1|nr:TraB/GumN family protein [Cellulophaga lytica]APU10257.1 polysaccharide biosynthesis protein GumN [Cellulophaga lytica]
MRILISSVLLFFLCFGTAQEKNSLLWEISGNGLKQTSYLYGTMHVSKKVAFRLDDVFYESLLKSDVVALESDPATWLEEDITETAVRYNYVPKGFYASSFIMNNPETEEVGSYLAFEDRILNGLLYRTSSFAQDFEEETYLDMFIYQAGQKFNKQIVALEDLQESTILVGRANLNAMKDKPDDWLLKKMQQKGMDFLLQDAYRERNINLIDSLDSGIYTNHYLKNMLYIRNQNMVNKLDTLLKTNKVFTGIGAAHLPGDKGVISLLRSKGYTVKPLTSKSGFKGKQLKEKIVKRFRENNYQEQAPDDDAFTVMLPNKMYPVTDSNVTSYIVPDLANGSYVMITRIPTFSYLKDDRTFDYNKIDELLFENIPGKILEKNKLEKNGVPFFEIKNLLKNGDHQRYQIYITPLEIIIFKMGGEGTYVQQFSDTIFNTIKLKKHPLKRVKVTSGFNDFSVEMPSNYIFPNKYRFGDRLVQGVDDATEDYFFLKKVTQNDLRFIEEDTFELKQIQKRFYQQLKIKANYKAPKNRALVSSAVLDSVSGKKLFLKSVVNGINYYLLGAVSKDSAVANTYFNSLELKSPTYNKDFTFVKDTALYFTTKSTVKPPNFSVNNYSFNNGRKKPKEYNPYTKTNIYQNNNGEIISVAVNKAHDFLMLPSVDSLWTLRKKMYQKKSFVIHKEQQSKTPEGYEQLNLVLTDTASTRGIFVRNIAKDGLLYEIKSVIDTTQKSSAYITTFINNFTPVDTVIGKSFLEDKTPLFFKALRENDSIALNGYRFINFEPKHLDSLEYYVTEFDFNDSQKKIQSHLIQQMGKLKSNRVIPFFTSFYEDSYNNSNAQTKILQAVAAKNSEASVKTLLDLMSKDLPLVSNSYEINTIFKPYLDSLPLAKQLFPKILEYSAIEEYKAPIFSILARLQLHSHIKISTYKKYKKQILNDAKIQLKRHLGKDNTNGVARVFGSRNTSYNTLEDYTILLFPFRKEKEVQWFYTKLLLSNDAAVKTTYVALLARSNSSIPIGILDSLAAKPASRKLLFDKLKVAKKLQVFPKDYYTQESLGESLIYLRNKYNRNKYTADFINQKDLMYKGTNYVGYYYKFTQKTSYDETEKIYLIVYPKSNEIGVQPFYQNKGRNFEDVYSQDEVIDMVTEEFILKDRKRAAVYRPNAYNTQFGYYNY